MMLGGVPSKGKEAAEEGTEGQGHEQARGREVVLAGMRMATGRRRASARRRCS